MPLACRAPLPRFLEPMLAASGGVPAGPGWAAEVKWDGLRGQLRHDGRRTTLRSRNGRDLSSAFPELVAEAGRRLQRRAALLDAGIGCLNADGPPDFAAVRAHALGQCSPRRATAKSPRDLRHPAWRRTLDAQPA